MIYLQHVRTSVLVLARLQIELLGLRLKIISLSIERQAAAGPSTEFHPPEPRRTPLMMQRRTPRSFLTCTAGGDLAAFQTSVHGLGLWEEKLRRHQEQEQNPDPVGLRALNASPGSVHGAEAQPRSLKLWKSLNIQYFLTGWLSWLSKQFQEYIYITLSSVYLS